MCIIKAAIFKMLQAKQFAERDLGNCDRRALCYIITYAHTANFNNDYAGNSQLGNHEPPSLQLDLGPIGLSIVLTTEGTPGRADIQQT
jgi:hypothetical protein